MREVYSLDGKSDAMFWKRSWGKHAEFFIFREEKIKRFQYPRVILGPGFYSMVIYIVYVDNSIEALHNLYYVVKIVTSCINEMLIVRARHNNAQSFIIDFYCKRSKAVYT